MLTAFTPVTIDPSYVIALLLVAFHASNRFNTRELSAHKRAECSSG